MVLMKNDDMRRFLGSSNITTAEAPESVSVESDMVVILAALLCAVICVVGLIAVGRCAWLHRTGRSPSHPSANKALKKKILHSLPIFTFNNNNNNNSSTQDCAICLADFAHGDQIRVLPQCGHAFHVGCIDTWLASHSSCPSCRQILLVARCHNCGHFPALSQPQLNARPDFLP